MSRTRISKEQWKEIEALIDSGEKTRDIAVTYGITQQSINSHYYRKGIRISKKAKSATNADNDNRKYTDEEVIMLLEEANSVIKELNNHITLHKETISHLMEENRKLLDQLTRDHNDAVSWREYHAARIRRQVEISKNELVDNMKQARSNLQMYQDSQ